MIPKQEILRIATTTNLSPQVIEKDYVLGWLLAGIFKHDELNKAWVFKGGTCLKKCYFETYRFSEDLDFTLKDSSHLDEAFLKKVFSQVGEWLYEETGIELPFDRMTFELFKNSRGNMSCQGRIFYRGPIAPTSPQQMPRIKLDLTVDEIIAEQTVPNFISHSYSDLLPQDIRAQCYQYVEVFAEKVRALSERTRPRDLYDVINFFRRSESRELAKKVRKVLAKKCDFKNITMPTYHALEPHKETCRVGWNEQLGHQLLIVPPFESFWNELPQFFNWLEGNEPDTGLLQSIPLKQGEIPIDIQEIDRVTLRNGVIDKICFAASNHLCIEIQYQCEDGQQKIYILEPYSLHKNADGHLLLYVLKHKTKEIRYFRIDQILSTAALSQPFIPSYRVELIPCRRR